MFLLTPAWLLGLGALSMPIVLHLLSRGRARSVRIGSVRWLTPDDSRRGTHLRPSQLLLLLLRCALLAAVVLALAGPRIWTRLDPGSGAPWVLVDPELLARRAALEPTVTEAFGRLEALRTAGAEVRLLAPGLPPLRDPGVVGAAVAPDPASHAAAPVDLWSLLREADRIAPTESVLHLFAVDRLDALTGERPRPARPTYWTLVPSAGENHWIEHATRTGDGAPSVVVGVSDATRTTFQAATVVTAPSGGPAAPAEVELLPGGRLRLLDGGVIAGDDEVTLDAAAGPLQAEVRFDPERADDAAAVLAALEAAAAFAGVPVAARVRPIDAGEDPAGGETPLRFWLSAAPVPASWRAAVSGVLVSDGLGQHESTEHPVLLPGATLAQRRQSPVDGVDGSVALWRDGAGRPVLEASRLGAGRWYRLHGRFHPAWSDLTLDAAFPAWMSDLLDEAAGGSAASSSRIGASDRRAARLLPPGAPPPSLDRDPERQPGPLPEALLWMAVAVGLAIERRLAARGAA